MNGGGFEAARRAPGARLSPAAPVWAEHVALVDLLDRLLAGGVVVAGEVTLSIAEVDLVRISLRAMVASVRAVLPEPEAAAVASGRSYPAARSADRRAP